MSDQPRLPGPDAESGEPVDHGIPGVVDGEDFTMFPAGDDPERARPGIPAAAVLLGGLAVLTGAAGAWQMSVGLGPACASQACATTAAAHLAAGVLVLFVAGMLALGGVAAGMRWAMRGSSAEHRLAANAALMAQIEHARRHPEQRLPRRDRPDQGHSPDAPTG